MKTVIVIGGGASGLMAALTAAKNKDNRVLVLERQQRPGRKLLATGNGRCNLTNTRCSIERYHGADAAFARPALEHFGPEDTLAFFSSLGLLTVEEYGGRVYPLSDSANSVLDVLRFALAGTGVELHTACRVESVRRERGGFAVACENESFFADALIVACGGAAGGKLGGVTDGYELLKALGHSRTKLYPALTPLFTAPEYPRALKGVRADAAVELRLGRAAVFDVSRAASVCGEGARISFDFFRGREDGELFAMLRARRDSLSALEAGELLCGMLHNRLGRMCVKYAGLSGAAPLRTLSDDELLRVLRACRAFTLEVRGTAGFDGAQVTAGGISTAEFDPDTLQSRLVPGLFACGEVLDVDGDCGGYNLQWAWSSGALAGRLGR